MGVGVAFFLEGLEEPLHGVAQVHRNPEGGPGDQLTVALDHGALLARLRARIRRGRRLHLRRRVQPVHVLHEALRRGRVGDESALLGHVEEAADAYVCAE